MAILPAEGALPPRTNRLLTSKYHRGQQEVLALAILLQLLCYLVVQAIVWYFLQKRGIHSNYEALLHENSLAI